MEIEHMYERHATWMQTKIELVLGELGFYIRSGRDVSGRDILDLAKKCSETEEPVSCFLFYFSGHGDEDAIYGHDYQLVHMKEIVEIFQPPN
eukprot:TRINITY_DN11550_c0_g1_i1.p1 TRINITY_DN11550_c0_g1~~TRINITY_DN11550_c0_g1_i1.p1  ORF type:complete len:92 (+),score=13.36 TRINITY_DN11550_c0_g1_i1:122-397(+)